MQKINRNCAWEIRSLKLRVPFGPEDGRRAVFEPYGVTAEWPDCSQLLPWERHVSQGRINWLALVNTVTHFQVPYNMSGIFLTRSGYLSISEFTPVSYFVSTVKITARCLYFRAEINLCDKNKHSTHPSAALHTRRTAFRGGMDAVISVGPTATVFISRALTLHVL